MAKVLSEEIFIGTGSLSDRAERQKSGNCLFGGPWDPCATCEDSLEKGVEPMGSRPLIEWRFNAMTPCLPTIIHQTLLTFSHISESIL
ncbi:hypothetical protein CDAR_488511 [Caerostris darwini]|uniref:Uncharacterized protein n=1 Tax=Caerostris darwini TaxID=1538125 RepID=A0AAV4WIC2_9ARAC|nr:hypothetical protein CDAR_488511 [Caerostris darwini]